MQLLQLDLLTGGAVVVDLPVKLPGLHPRNARLMQLFEDASRPLC